MNERYYDRQLTIYDGTEKPRGVYGLIHDVDNSVKELRDEFYEFKKETEHRFTKLKKKQNNLDWSTLAMVISWTTLIVVKLLKH